VRERERVRVCLNEPSLQVVGRVRERERTQERERDREQVRVCVCGGVSDDLCVCV